GLGRRNATGPAPPAAEFSAYRLQPDTPPGRLTGDLRHLLHGQQLTATVAGVDEIAADAGCDQQAPIHLGRAQLKPTGLILIGTAVPGQAEQGRTLRPDNSAELAGGEHPAPAARRR